MRGQRLKTQPTSSPLMASVGISEDVAFLSYAFVFDIRLEG